MRFFIFIFAILLLSFTGAESYSGYLNIELDSGTFNAGESISGNFVVSNSEKFAFNDAYIVVNLVSGGKDALGYPTQFSDEGVIFFEEKLEFVLFAGEVKEIPFNFSLPSDLKDGTYTIDAYFRTERTHVSGVPHILISPRSKEFSVRGNGNFPGVNIVRTKTNFAGQTGPVGAPVDPGSNVKGEVFVRNEVGVEKNVVVYAGLCIWDDTSCEDFLSEDSRRVSIDAGSEEMVELNLVAPDNPNAYAIRIEVRDGNRLLSLYRSRLIVVGGTARIRQLNVSEQQIRSGEQVQVNVVVGASPDHYNLPSFDDFSVRTSIEAGGNVIFERIEEVEVLRFSEAFKKFSYFFIPEENFDVFLVCSEILKNGVVDKYCFEVSESREEKYAAGLRIIHDYDFVTGVLNINICGFDEDNEPQVMDGKVILNKGDGKQVLSENLTGFCFDENLGVEEEVYMLIIDDFVNSKQYSERLDFSVLKNSCAELGGFLCGENEFCASEELDSAERSVCCSSVCNAESRVFVNNQDSERVDLVIPLAGALVIILVLILLFGIWGRKEVVS